MSPLSFSSLPKLKMAHLSHHLAVIQVKLLDKYAFRLYFLLNMGKDRGQTSRDLLVHDQTFGIQLPPRPQTPDPEVQLANENGELHFRELREWFNHILPLWTESHPPHDASAPMRFISDWINSALILLESDGVRISATQLQWEVVRQDILHRVRRLRHLILTGHFQ